MATYKITHKDGSTNQIVGGETFCKEVTKDGGSYELIPPHTLDQEQINDIAKDWRNGELAKTDTLYLLDDYPDKDKLKAYRQALRDWPSTADFPDKKPTLGS